MASKTRRARRTDAITEGENKDPITGAPGAHPVGTGAGAAGGAVAGAAIGSAIGGPAGFAVGGTVGAIAGGLAGKHVAESVNATEEDDYWRENFSTRPYATDGASYDSYRPAYQYGWEARERHRGRSFRDVEAELAAGWATARGECELEWDEARNATRDAWDRVDRYFRE